MMLSLGTLRTIPSWCNWPLIGGVSDLLGVEACKPYTSTEIESDFQVGLATACRNAADPDECAARNRILYDEQLAAVQHTTPEAEAGACEYEASQSHPDLSKLLGAGAVCKLYSGNYASYIIGAVVVGAILLATRSGRGRRR
jgi:hypothetical protein